MRTERTEMIPTKIITWKCDFCDFTTEHNTYCCGYANIMHCSICDKDVCQHHRKFYVEDHSSDHYDLLACQNCIPAVDSAWEKALGTAERYENIVDLTLKILSHSKEEK